MPTFVYNPAEKLGGGREKYRIHQLLHEGPVFLTWTVFSPSQQQKTPSHEVRPPLAC